jgi:hypothetical protein
MSLPFNLQKLPPEALDVLRYMGKTATSATTDQLEDGTGIAARTIGKAIRRLVNYDYISLGVDGGYQLTSDGQIAVKQIAEYDAETGNAPAVAKTEFKVQRRLTVVMPRSLVAGKSTDLYIGVNPPAVDDQSKLPGTAHIELKLSAVGGTLSSGNVALDIPPDKAAAPSKISLTPVQAGKAIRVRIDAFQAFEFDSMEPLGGMYFDVQVTTQPVEKDATRRAVGMDVALRPPR